MSKIRSKDTKPERRVRRYLHSNGYRYRVHSNLPGKPDMVFTKQKVIVFIHGCFWHQHGCSMSYTPKTNQKFWKNKLDANVKRDQAVSKRLESDGWQIVTLWECEIYKNVDATVEKVTNVLKGEAKAE